MGVIAAMLPTPAPSPTIDPCNHPPAIIAKAPLLGYEITPQMRRGAVVHGASDPFGAASINGVPPTYLAVSIDVTIRLNGSTASARVVEPSGDMSFDRASIEAALRSTYSPATIKCTVVLGHYTFTETLQPNY